MKITNQKIILHKDNFNIINKGISVSGNPIRFIVVESDDHEYVCEVDTLDWDTPVNIFAFTPRTHEDTTSFNIAFSIPTGVGAELGGHAGDASVAVRLFASICDNLITHPNCVNAANYNSMPENVLYVEGSTFTRLFMGSVSLSIPRSNKILLLMDKSHSHHIQSEIVNAVSTARMMLGIDCHVHMMSRSISSSCSFSGSGRASGEIDNIELLFNEIDKFPDYNAICLSTALDLPLEYYNDYFVANKMSVNPWGSPEAMITHAVALRYNLPCAHAPLMSSHAAGLAGTYGIVDLRKAAESESIADIYCCLRGLHQAPRISSSGLSSANISCLVIPYGCVGLPVLAAFASDIPVIAVKENKNLMKNRYSDYACGRLYVVENYWEALAVCQCIKSGIDPLTVRRPVSDTIVI